MCFMIKRFSSDSDAARNMQNSAGYRQLTLLRNTNPTIVVIDHLSLGLKRARQIFFFTLEFHLQATDLLE